MAELAVGDRVRHPKFGAGTLLEINPEASQATGLVRWDTHRVNNPNGRGYDNTHSWVYMYMLSAERSGHGP